MILNIVFLIGINYLFDKKYILINISIKLKFYREIVKANEKFDKNTDSLKN